MKFRETVKYHNAVEYTQIFVDMSPAKFKERYGMTFNEWKDGLPDGDYRKNFKFNECYVDDDPYDLDIFGKTPPLIENSPEQLYESCIDSAYEI